MKSIQEIDENFKANQNIGKADVRFYSVKESPFCIYGIFHEDGKFRRLPQAVAEKVSEGVLELHAHTAGGRVRFRTNSTYVAMHADMPNISKMSHFPITGSGGFDLYENVNGEEQYVRTFVPPFDVKDGYEGVIELGEGEHEVTIHFPLYSEVSELYIGLQETATVSAPAPYLEGEPIVYYGSSITQGGCASRPGNAYQNILTRKLRRDHINLGFSGSAKGEDAIIEYIASLPMSMFVCDYDHNAPTVEHLNATHEKLVKAVRQTHPTIPIVMLSRPKFRITDEEKERLEIVKKTYRNAKTAGDENVYFMPGSELMAMARDEGTVDNAHPNDLGFTSMAKALLPLLESLL